MKAATPHRYVIVYLHWGVEYQQTPTRKQRRDAYLLIDAGADAIIGHHPHVIQKEETYKNKPIFYSLGNFIFDQNGPETKRGLLLQLTFSPKGIQYLKHPIEINRCKPCLSQAKNEKIHVRDKNNHRCNKNKYVCDENKYVWNEKDLVCNENKYVCDENK
jgi:poly-gamma-glutamate capsule biosynthesis protein CapA/YwtB (metallophosphatase superfamily)